MSPGSFEVSWKTSLNWRKKNPELSCSLPNVAFKRIGWERRGGGGGGAVGGNRGSIVKHQQATLSPPPPPPPQSAPFALLTYFRVHPTSLYRVCSQARRKKVGWLWFNTLSRKFFNYLANTCSFKTLTVCSILFSIITNSQEKSFKVQL